MLGIGYLLAACGPLGVGALNDLNRGYSPAFLIMAGAALAIVGLTGWVGPAFSKSAGAPPASSPNRL